MKKIMFILLISVISVSVHAQFAKTKWTGAIKGDNAQKATLKFSKDTLVLAAADGSVIETMSFSVKNNILTIKKIAGQSDCDTATPGKYTFEIKNGTLNFSAASDACYDRSSALDKTVWKKG
jgi:hypothetical protein